VTGRRIFFALCRFPARSNVVRARCRSIIAVRTGKDIEAAFLGGTGVRPETPEGSTGADCREAIMSMSEYEERLRPPAPSLHQIFAATWGRDRGRRWRRCVLVATAVLAMVTMTCKVAPHHTVDSLTGIQSPTGDGWPIARRGARQRQTAAHQSSTRAAGNFDKRFIGAAPPAPLSAPRAFAGSAELCRIAAVASRGSEDRRSRVESGIRFSSAA
jgi:hypothetical protein